MIADRLARLAGIESRATLKDPPEWLLDALGGTKAISGVEVSETSALRHAAVFACVRVISETVAMLPLNVYQREGDRSRVRLDSHPLASVLRLAPNPEQTAFEFWENVTGYLNLWGRAPIFRERVGSSVALWHLPPNRVESIRDDDSRLVAWTIDLGDGNVRRVEADEIVLIRAFGYSGKTPIQNARETIGGALAADEFSARFFSNDARPGGVIQIPQEAGGEVADRIEAKWKAAHTGVVRSHLVAILTGGASWQDVGMPPGDAQLIESRKFSKTEIAGIFRVPPHKIADLERATFSNIEDQSISFVTDTIAPWLGRIEQAVRVALFPREKLGSAREVWPEFLVEKLLRGDIEKRYKSYAIGRQWGFLSGNDIRVRENLPEVEGLDNYLEPVNMNPSGGELGPEGEPEEETEPVEADPATNGSV